MQINNIPASDQTAWKEMTVTFLQFDYSSAPGSIFFKVAFWRPKIVKWSPNMKYQFPEKRDILCNTTWMFERIKMEPPTIAIKFRGACYISRLNTQRARLKLGKCDFSRENIPNSFPLNRWKAWLLNGLQKAHSSVWMGSLNGWMDF